MSYQLSYDEVAEFASSMYQREGAALPVVKYLKDMVAGTSGELRGRILNLLADYTTEHGDLETALGTYVDALETLTTPKYRFAALACAMDVCVQSRRWKQGMRYALEAETIMSLHSGISDKWLGVYYLNSGRLALNASDFVAAADDIRASARHFLATGNSENEAQNAEVYLGEVLFHAGSLEEAKKLCQLLRSRATNRLIRYRIDTLESMIHARLGNLPEAERLAMRSIDTACRELGKMMHETYIMSMCAVAEIVKQKNGGDAENILRYFIKTLASYGQIDADEIIKGMMR